MRRILWFRRDLRSEDHPLLSLEGEILPIFIFDPNILEGLPAGDRRVAFIFQTLLRVKRELRKNGRDIALFYGDPKEVFGWILARQPFEEVCASGDYDSYALERDRTVSHLLPFRSLRDTYLFGPDEVLKPDGSPYLVFTPYYNRAKALFTPAHMETYTPKPQKLIDWNYDAILKIRGDSAQVLPLSPESIGFSEISEPAPPPVPHEKLARFDLASYQSMRDFPSLDGTSGLGIELRFGTISIRQVLRWLKEQKQQGITTEPFFRELMFREFYAMLLYYFPRLATENFRYRFYGIDDPERYEAFCEARTGVPIVDAGIRQLLETGEMHNRVRMIAASFFTKNLLLPWHRGEAFFARFLNDYDAASNILSWQWSAGTGVDPQPYFRIFNPWLQAKKFDRDGDYIRRWLPQLRHLPSSLLHDETYHQRNEIPGYPRPIVDHRRSSQAALEYFKSLL